MQKDDSKNYNLIIVMINKLKFLWFNDQFKIDKFNN